MKKLELPGLSVTLHKPVRLCAMVGHAWFPVVHQFPSGELIARWSVMPDTHCFAYVSANSHSLDGGKTWSPAYSMGQFGNVCSPLPDGSLRMTPYYMYPDPPTQKREFVTDLYTLHPGGNYEVEPRAARITGLPHDLSIESTGAARFNFTGTAVELDGKWLYTIYGQLDRSEKYLYDLLLVSSDDHGRTWEYVSTIASHRDVPPRGDLPGGILEGPDEASLCLLSTGELVCVYRVGSGLPKWPYHISRSKDGGRTWTRAAVMCEGVGSVEPSLKRLNSGTLALSGGRPGIHLWLTNAEAMTQWHDVNIAEHHNATCEPHERLQVTTADSPAVGDYCVDSQSTCYTELCEIAPNRLLMMYDRSPMGWNQVPLDSTERSMIFAVEVQVQRK